MTNGLNLVIMANVFNTPKKLSECYDLKGSTVGRTTQEVGATMKDLDFMVSSFSFSFLFFFFSLFLALFFFFFLL